MADPVAFISRFQVHESMLDQLEAMFRDVARDLEAGKPRTASQVAYVDQAGALTIIHVFPDASAMDAHFLGADERGARAMTLMDPRGWEVYGPVSESALGMLRELAEAKSVPLAVQPRYVGGFVRHKAAPISA